MNDLLFSVPWWIPTVLVITGISLMVRGKSHRESANPQHWNRRDTAWRGLGGDELSGGYAKGNVYQQTRKFVQSVVARDWMTFDDLLGPNVRFQFAEENWDIKGRDGIDAAVRAKIDHVGVSSASVGGLEASENEDVVTTSFRVFSVQKATMDEPITSDWDLDWRKSSAGDWAVSEIRCRGIGNLDAKSIQGSLPVK